MELLLGKTLGGWLYSTTTWTVYSLAFFFFLKCCQVVWILRKPFIYPILEFVWNIKELAPLIVEITFHATAYTAATSKVGLIKLRILARRVSKLAYYQGSQFIKMVLSHISKRTRRWNKWINKVPSRLAEEYLDTMVRSEKVKQFIKQLSKTETPKNLRLADPSVT